MADSQRRYYQEHKAEAADSQRRYYQEHKVRYISDDTLLKMTAEELDKCADNHPGGCELCKYLPQCLTQWDRMSGSLKGYDVRVLVAFKDR